MEEELLERVEQKKHYKTIIELTKVVKEVETTSVIKKVAVFPEEKRDYVMSLLETEPTVVGASGHIKAGAKNLHSPQPKLPPQPPVRRALSKYLDSQFSNTKVFNKK